MRVRIIDPAGVQRGAVEVTACSVVLRDCGVHTWMIETSEDAAGPVGEGWRVVIRDGGIAVSGLVSKRRVEMDGPHLVTVLSGVSETTALADRLVYPDPARGEDQQSTAYSYKATGPAETVIRDMVHLNAGTGALAVRRQPYFTVTASQGRGATVTMDHRWGNLLEDARFLARAGGVVFDAVWEQGQAVLRFRERRDLSRQVRFSPGNGGVADGAALELNAPEATTAIVAGQGEGTARMVRVVTRAPAWGRRIEVFKDQRDEADPAGLVKAGDEELDGKVASASATVPVVEVPGCVLGTDYQLGDTVSVLLGGARVSEPVRQAEVSWDGHGRTVKLSLGDHDQQDDDQPAWVAQVRALDARMRGMETI